MVPDKEKELITSIAGQSALALKNAISYQDLKTHAENMEFKSITDGLTGLNNHITFQNVLSKKMTDSINKNIPLSLILFDIDHFKKFNDNYGHRFGDSVLQEVAAITKRSFRNTDFLARYGGEEFAVILNTENSGAYIAAEQLRKNIEAHLFQNSSTTAKVSISLGVASWDGQSNKTELIENADNALYQSKNNGRNKTSIF